MPIATTRILPATQANIEETAAVLRGGGLVAFPTETVYGLGADATDARAVAAVFAAKDRPRFNPLIVHVAGLDAARRLVRFDERAEALAAAFWPGPLTLALPRQADCGVSLLASAGGSSLAVRWPRHAVAQRLLDAVGRPVVAPSANPAGRVSPTTAAHVARWLEGKVAIILDGGPCSVGIESTVVDLTGARARLLRPGGIDAEALGQMLGEIDLEPPSGEAAPRSPGMLASHYAPDLPLRLEARTVRPGEALLAFGPQPLAGAAAVANLSPGGDLIEAAANLFAMLHALDRPDFTGIAVMPIPDEGLGRAINDRLRRAAAPRGGGVLRDS